MVSAGECAVVHRSHQLPILKGRRVQFRISFLPLQSLLPPPAPSDLRLRVGGVFGAEGVWIPRGRHDGELSPAQRVRRLGHLNGVLGVPLFELFL